MTHSLRLSILFLRLAIGIDLIYLGWTALFNQALGINLHDHAFGSLYSWLSAPNTLPWLPSLAAWAFLIIGICLVIGLFTRLTSLIAIVLILVSYLPTISLAHFNIAQLVNDELIMLFSLLVLIFGRAGQYFGVDKFLRWSRKHKEE